MRVGVEVGGTFTDLVAVDGDRIEVVKVPSTPSNPDIGAFNALTSAAIDLTRVTDLVHGSTIATNAILERKGARVAFVTTAGFRDILFFQRHDRRNIYDLKYAKPAPPLRRRDCFEVEERIDGAGRVVVPLNETAVTDVLIPQLTEGGYGAVAICLLSAYAAPVHEARVKALIAAALPQVRVACSHEVAREFREFERASTTVLSAYVQPVIDGYLSRFEKTLAAAKFGGEFSVMQSNGGRLPAAAMRRNAITALFSGPAAGVVGAVRQAKRSGRGNLITFDMGGTSTDVCLVVNGVPSIAAETEVNGLPVRTPVLDIVSVGAGGGSLAWLDNGGMLRVGPRSAGAAPGPACRVIEYSLRPDSCGRGQSRGGLGFLRRYEILKDGVRLSFFSDRFRLAADGLLGGESGATGYLQVARGGKIIDLKSKAAFDFVKGDIVTLAVGGGGGYGPAAGRLQQRIEDDVADGFISGGVAREWRARG